MAACNTRMCLRERYRLNMACRRWHAGRPDQSCPCLLRYTVGMLAFNNGAGSKMIGSCALLTGCTDETGTASEQVPQGDRAHMYSLPAPLYGIFVDTTLTKTPMRSVA